MTTSRPSPNYVVELAAQSGRYGYDPVTTLVRRHGQNVNQGQVERIWRREAASAGRAA